MDEKFILQDRQEKLAHSFIAEYLQREGYSLGTLGALPAERIRQVMIQASMYASTRLTEIEDRAQLVTSLHHVTESLT